MAMRTARHSLRRVSSSIVRPAWLHACLARWMGARWAALTWRLKSAAEQALARLAHCMRQSPQSLKAPTCIKEQTVNLMQQ